MKIAIVFSDYGKIHLSHGDSESTIMFGVCCVNKEAMYFIEGVL